MDLSMHEGSVQDPAQPRPAPQRVFHPAQVPRLRGTEVEMGPVATGGAAARNLPVRRVPLPSPRGEQVV